MSGFSTPLGGATPAPPKQISSRLLNMKFMQRAAASSTQNAPTTPFTPTGERHPKRRRTGDDFSRTVSNLNSPSTAVSSTVNTPSHGDRAAITGAFSTETNFLPTRRGTNNFETPGEETEWVLDMRFPATNGTTNGTSRNHVDDEDNSEDSEDEVWSSAAPRGRQTYGSFKKKRNTGGGLTSKVVNGESTPSKKRDHPDGEDGEDDLSPAPSSSGSDDRSDGEVDETPPQQKKKPKKFDFTSEADLKKMDAIDFQVAGFDHGFGRQRHGLGGGGGGGGVVGGTPGHNRNRGQGKGKKKARKTM